ncbi:MAG: AlkZ family DNA glycosylase [Anaerolineales bacterium]|nr:AlkZ family DNA glycosylase [Anaerolineales bacterium]
MNPIGGLRLANQRIAQPGAGGLAELVAHMGAMQAQDYAAVKYAAALRLAAQPSHAEVEEAIAGKQVVRVWSLRGTIHLLPTRDAAWIIKLVGQRPLAGGRTIMEREGLDAAVQAKSVQVLQRALQGGRLLERSALYAELEAAGISTEGQRGYHLLAHAGLRGQICIGPLSGKQPTFGLLAEWAPDAVELDGQEALAELARRYFCSHGPATMADFAWWAGLTLTQGRAALDSLRAELIEERSGEASYWLMPGSQAARGLFLLPSFDEFIVGYKERSAVIAPELEPALIPYKNGIIQPVIVSDGQVVGTWKRTAKKDSLTFEFAPFEPLAARQVDRLQEAAEHYALYLGLKIKG